MPNAIVTPIQPGMPIILFDGKKAKPGHTIYQPAALPKMKLTMPKPNANKNDQILISSADMKIRSILFKTNRTVMMLTKKIFQRVGVRIN